jgi:hypothetical protein
MSFEIAVISGILADSEITRGLNGFGSSMREHPLV